MKRLVITAGVWLLTALILAGPAAADRPDGGTDYVVGIEDKLSIVVWGEVDLSRTVSVRPDGKITVPLINDVSVAGLTPERIRQVIAERLAQFVRDPSVTVVVEEINSFRVYFLGEINNQGALQFLRPTRLIQGIAAAGGLTEFSKRRITLLREQGGIEKRFEIDYKQLVAGAPGQENLHLKPGDTLLFH